MLIGKMGDRLVEIVKIADRVQFSDKVGWVCIVVDFQVESRKQQNIRWVPATTRFEWVREFRFSD